MNFFKNQLAFYTELVLKKLFCKAFFCILLKTDIENRLAFILISGGYFLNDYLLPAEEQKE